MNKKIKTCCLVVCIIYVLIASGCSITKLEIPDYPLKKETIKDTFNEHGFDIIIEQDLSSEKIIFNIKDEKNEEFFLGISSAINNGQRMLAISLPSFYMSNAVSLEQSENIINTVSILFGGFTSEEKVYSSFIKEYGKKNTKINELGRQAASSATALKEELYWEKEIDDIECQIVVAKPQDDESKDYIKSISFSTDSKVFNFKLQ